MDQWDKPRPVKRKNRIPWNRKPRPKTGLNTLILHWGRSKMVVTLLTGSTISILSRPVNQNRSQ